MALLFLSKLPERKKIYDLLSRITTCFAQKTKGSTDCPAVLNCLYELFDEVISTLHKSSKHLEKSDSLQVELLTLQVSQILLEYCVNHSKPDKFNVVLGTIEIRSSLPLVGVLVSGYMVVMATSEMNSNGDDRQLTFELLSVMNQKYTAILKGELNHLELKLLHHPLGLLFHVCNSKVQQKIQSDAHILEALASTCDIMRKVTNLCLERDKAHEQTKDGKTEKNVEDLTKCYFSKCQKLQLTLFLLKANSKYTSTTAFFLTFLKGPFW